VYFESMGRKVLDSLKLQRRILEAIRKTGRIDMAYRAAGISEQTLQRYRHQHPVFDNAVLEAQEYYKFKQELEYGAGVRRKGLELLEKLIDREEINHNVLLKFLFERDGRIGN